MRGGTARIAAAAAAATVFELAMVLVHALKLPVMRYHPLDRAWELTSTGGSVPMMYYGQLLWASIAAAITWLSVLLFPKKFWTQSRINLTIGWLLLSCLLAASYYAHANWP